MHHYFSMIVLLSTKSVLMLSGLDDSYIGGWLLGVVSTMGSDACIFWMTNSKVFFNYSSFS